MIFGNRRTTTILLYNQIQSIVKLYNWKMDHLLYHFLIILAEWIYHLEIVWACSIQSNQCASYHEIMGVKVNQICRIYCSNLHALPILKPVMCRRNVLRALVEKNHICLPIYNWNALIAQPTWSVIFDYLH